MSQIFTIHQPSSSIFELFDDLCILAAGDVAYFGPAKEAMPYFSTLGSVGTIHHLAP